MRKLKLMWICAAAVAACIISVVASDLKLKATLVWGTDEAKPNVPNLKPADDKVVKGLRHFKWKYYFEVTNTTVSVAANTTNKFRLSPKSEVALHNMGKDGMEAIFYGEGNVVYKKKGPIPPGENWALGGDDPKNATAWFVILTPQGAPAKKD